MSTENSKKGITIAIDIDGLEGYTDDYLALCWHVAQANPDSPFESPEPGMIAEHVGREIIRRWLIAVPPRLWDVQGKHFRIGERAREMPREGQEA